jgi:hypothetical protein
MPEKSWKEINKEVKKEQPQRNKDRLRILEQEFNDLIDHGLYDKSLLGDIEHQRKNIKGFDFPSESDIDVELKDVPTIEEEFAKIYKDTSATNVMGFPLNLLDTDFKKLLGIESI